MKNIFIILITMFCISVSNVMASQINGILILETEKGQKISHNVLFATEEECRQRLIDLKQEVEDSFGPFKIIEESCSISL